MTFYLGTHRPYWLAQLDIPLFVSRRQLARYRTLPRALGPWALDSGGFTELSQYGAWTCGAREYAKDVKRFAAEVGNLAWAASQDWMCEPWITEKTGLTVAEHQARTVGNYLDLMALECPVIPVLQGWRLADYDRCVEMYVNAGVDLFSLPVVGLGSVCRRQATDEISELVWHLKDAGLSLHGFGVKLEGLRNVAPALTSSDSMAWSFRGRMEKRPGHTHAAKNCANCLPWALEWRGLALEAGSAPVWRQLGLYA